MLCFISTSRVQSLSSKNFLLVDNCNEFCVYRVPLVQEETEACQESLGVAAEMETLVLGDLRVSCIVVMLRYTFSLN